MGARFGSVTFHDRLARARVTIAPEERFGPIPGGMVETAENLAKQYEIPRQEQDEFALRSHQRAVAARDSGKFDAEIVPVSIPQRRGDPKIFDTDEGPRGDTTMDALGTPASGDAGWLRYRRQRQQPERCGLGVPGGGRG